MALYYDNSLTGTIYQGSNLLGSMYYNNGQVNQGYPVDPDANAFIIATGITGLDATAITQLVIDLKLYNVWDKLQAAYPFVGGTANSNKYNLVNPVDSDAAFRLTFYGGVTHNSNGVTFDGINGYANTYFNCSASFVNGTQSAHISVYNRTNDANTTGSEFFMGAREFITGRYCAIQFEPTRQNYCAVNVPEVRNLPDYTSLQGFILATRPIYNGEFYYFNSTLIGDKPVVVSTSVPSSSLAIGARSNNPDGSPQSGTYTAYNCAFATIGTGLVSGSNEETNLYNAIQTYQTTLGRQV